MISEKLFTDNDNKRKEDHTIFLEATSIIEINLHLFTLSHFLMF